MIATEPDLLWFPVLRRVPQARLRLFCFPYAGGSASAFGRWPEQLPAGVDVRPVQLPGRWNRLGETPLRRFDDMVRAIGEVLPSCLDRPFAFFGHSMGALLAFALARQLRARGLPQPRTLFVSGHRAPHLPDALAPMAGLSDEAFIEALRAFHGTPSEVLEQPDLMRVLLPAIRADFEACRSFAYEPAPPLSCPVIVLGGNEDPESAGDLLDAWSRHTIAKTLVQRFPGDHFFIHSAEALVLSALSLSLRALLDASSPFSL
jgi:medium-chain acyl-[acyl-carrier-protein] hydrolase